jgi:hypothetical protein
VRRLWRRLSAAWARLVERAQDAARANPGGEGWMDVDE